jgi:hypothetical protein
MALAEVEQRFARSRPRPHVGRDGWTQCAGVPRSRRADANAASRRRLLSPPRLPILGARLERDAESELWRCFEAERGGRRLRVCERIVDARGMTFIDASSRFRAAGLGGSPGPRQAITVAGPIR